MCLPADMQIIDDSQQQLHTHVQQEEYEEMLNKNIVSLRGEITEYCDALITRINRRRDELLNELEGIRQGKAFCIDKSEFVVTSATVAEVRAKKSILNDAQIVTIGSCLRFIPDSTLSGLIDNYGKIDEERASAANSRVSGLDLEYAIVNEPIQFELETRNKDGDLSWVEQDRVVVQIKQQNSNEDLTDCIIQNRCNGTYAVMSELPHVGTYHINIYVNNNLITGCPLYIKSVERKDIKFIESEDQDDVVQWSINSEKTALVGKSEKYQLLNFSTACSSPAHAWKVKVTTACKRIKMKFGYAYNMRYVPDLREEFCKKIDFSELLAQTQFGYLPTRSHRSGSGSHQRKKERKQSTYERNTLTFFIVQDTLKKLVHIAIEELKIYHTISYNEHKFLEPFIGIKHFCTNSACPRPTLTLL